MHTLTSFYTSMRKSLFLSITHPIYALLIQVNSERPAQSQMRDESIIERTIRASNHCRRALLSGYTTYRDLGTEGMQSFDANLRDSINRDLLPGPRLFVATEALCSSGSYEVRSENRANGDTPPRISDPCDGVDGVRRAVRRRVGAGADIIKFYADYRRQAMRFPSGLDPISFPPTEQQHNPARVMFSQDEMHAMVSEAKLANLPIACHAGSLAGAMMAARAGVTTIEHGHEASPDLFREMKRNNVLFVPTLAVVEAISPAALPEALRTAKLAFDQGVRMAAGGDTGAFNHGEGARETELLMQAGIPVEDALEMVTLAGWEACGGDRCGFRFGWFEAGNRADIIALDSDPRTDAQALRKVGFVMKDGKVWKRDGIPVGFIDIMMQDAGHTDPSWLLV